MHAHIHSIHVDINTLKSLHKLYMSTVSGMSLKSSSGGGGGGGGEIEFSEDKSFP